MPAQDRGCFSRLRRDSGKQRKLLSAAAQNISTEKEKPSVAGKTQTAKRSRRRSPTFGPAWFNAAALRKAPALAMAPCARPPARLQPAAPAWTRRFVPGLMMAPWLSWGQRRRRRPWRAELPLVCVNESTPGCRQVALVFRESVLAARPRASPWRSLASFA